MSVIEISTDGMHKTREARIDGHVFTVREMGAGDKLDLSQYQSAMSNLGVEILNLQGRLRSMVKAVSGDTVEALKDTSNADLLKQMDDAVKKVSQYQKKTLEILSRQFDDGTKENLKSIELVNKYGTDGIDKILKQVFEAEDK